MKKGIDYIGVGCGALILNKKGKILLLKRGKNVQNESGTWSLPGGTVEFGESRHDAVIREIKEELGCTIKPLETLTVVDHFVPQERQHWITTIFTCIITDGIPQNVEPEKCDAAEWMGVEEIEKVPLANHMPAILSAIRKRFPSKINFYELNQ